MFTENCKTSDFSATCFLYSFIKGLRKTLKYKKTLKYLSLKETGTSYKHKSISTKNFGKKSLTKSKTFKQNFERAENFDIYFSNF